MRAPMPIDRRQLLAGGGALATAMLLGGETAAAKSAAHHAIKVGNADVTVVSDGHLNVGLRLLNRDLPPEVIETVVKAAMTAPGQVRYGINVVAVRGADGVTLIDTGSGGNWETTAGKLTESLEAAGIEPGAVRRVVITHCHPDHLWGLIDELDDSLRYPNAEIVLPKAEAEFWLGVDITTLSASGQAIGTAAKRILKLVEGKMRLVTPGSEIAPGLAFMATPGHTPGHSSVEIVSGTDRLIVAADTVFHALTSFPHPDWQPPGDMDAAAAIASRKRLLDRAAGEKLRLIAYHLPFPGIGYVERSGGAYRWVAA